MTIIELAKLLASKISQGKGNWEVTAFQWHEGAQPVGDVLEREATNTIEFYSHPDGAALANPVVEDDLDDLI